MRPMGGTLSRIFGAGPGAKITKPSQTQISGSRIEAQSIWRSSSGYGFVEDALPIMASPWATPGVSELADLIIDGHLAGGRRGLVICAPAAGVGVSFVSANLAVALAARGVSTRLVDTNLRSPSLSSVILAPAPSPGLSDLLLEHDLTLSEILHADVLENLSVVFAGEKSERAADLLSMNRFSSFVRDCLRDSVCTIFDAAPSNRSADARVVAKQVGYALIVARRHRSFYDDVSFLAEQLKQDDVIVIGTILNGN